MKRVPISLHLVILCLVFLVGCERPRSNAPQMLDRENQRMEEARIQQDKQIQEVKQTEVNTASDSTDTEHLQGVEYPHDEQEAIRQKQKAAAAVIAAEEQVKQQKVQEQFSENSYRGQTEKRKSAQDRGYARPVSKEQVAQEQVEREKAIKASEQADRAYVARERAARKAAQGN